MWREQAIARKQLKEELQPHLQKFLIGEMLNNAKWHHSDMMIADFEMAVLAYCQLAPTLDMC